MTNLYRRLTKQKRVTAKSVGKIVSLEPENESKHRFELIITSSLTETTGTTAEGLTVPTNPYRGLYAFQEADVDYFFGQEVATDSLVKAVANP